MPGGYMHSASIRRRCRELAASGFSYRAISRELDISYNSARRYALGWNPKNAQRLCPECGDELRRRADRDGWLCPECQASFSRWTIMSTAERANTQARTVESVKRIRARRRLLIAEAKAQPCVDCGRSFPPTVMHLDHVRGKKRFAVSTSIRDGRRDEEILAEIAKCEVRCANCHAMRHVQLMG